MDAQTKGQVTQLLSGFMEGIIEKRTRIKPFNSADVENANPFGFRLVPIEIWKGSKFERSFVTSLGQRVFEQLARIIAEGSGAFAENQHIEEITINTYRIEKIDEILGLFREHRRPPNWSADTAEVLALHNQRFETIRVNFDLYVRRHNGSEEYYSIKTVKPNLDQTQIAKRDMLRIKAAKENCFAYFGLPYNPAGELGDYRSVHSIPYSIFDMDHDNCVLIGSAFWNKVGANASTYRELLEIFREIGAIYEPIIRRDYLGLV